MSLTSAQLQALKSDIAVQVAGGSGTAISGLDPTNPDQAFAIADWYNEDSTLVAWKTSIPNEDVGVEIDGQNLADLTSANQERLQSWFITKSQAMPEKSDHRAFFDDIFSGTAGSETRNALNGDGTNDTGLWRRFASRVESLLKSSGSGSNADPCVLDFEGSIAYQDVLDSNNV